MQMDRGELTPRTRLLDTPYDAEGFLAENYDGTYSGYVYADDALRRSLNVPMVRMLRKAGLHKFLDFTSAAGFSSLAEQRPRLGLSMILGGCGVTLEELVGAYAAFPSGGKYASAEVRSRRAGPGEAKQIFSPSSAWMVTEILRGLDRPDLPNNFEFALNLPAVAFKTGTSYGRRDAWSVGYSAEYTVGVWIGNVDQKGNPELVGGKSAAPLLIDIFNSISRRDQKTILPEPKDIRGRLVCARSGLLPGPRCENLIDDVCSASHHVAARLRRLQRGPRLPGREALLLSLLRRRPSVPYRDAGGVSRRSSWISGASRGRRSSPRPRITRAVPGSSAGTGPSIVSPSDDMTYYFVAKKQKLVLQATSGVDVREHAWYVNDTYLGKTKPGRSSSSRSPRVNTPSRASTTGGGQPPSISRSSTSSNS